MKYIGERSCILADCFGKDKKILNRTRDYYIHMRKKKIKERKRKIHNLTSYNQIVREKIQDALSGENDGLFSKNHYGAIGWGIKTKTKKSYASYRHKGGYGSVKRYSRHDKVQINYMDQELKDYYNNDEKGL